VCALPDGRLASGSDDHTIRLRSSRFEVDAPIYCLTTPSSTHLVAGDGLGQLRWLEVVDLPI
jgi:hypothetical protein